MFAECLVPQAGIEPARPFGQQILSLPRLPVPPLGQQEWWRDDTAALAGVNGKECGADGLAVGARVRDLPIRPEAVKAAIPEANVMAVGLIVTPQQAEALLVQGKADLVAVARAVLDDPNTGHHAAVSLGAAEALPVQYERAAAEHWPGYAAARSA